MVRVSVLNDALVSIRIINAGCKRERDGIQMKFGVGRDTTDTRNGRSRKRYQKREELEVQLLTGSVEQHRQRRATRKATGPHPTFLQGCHQGPLRYAEARSVCFLP